MDIYPQCYYVYFYLRSKDSETAKAGTPYYVGKGKGNRRYNEHIWHIPPKDKTKNILVEQNLTELQAFILERYYIRWFGRKDLGKGILRNKTDGGEGVDPETARFYTNKRIQEGRHNFLDKHRNFIVKNPFSKRSDGSSVSSDRVKRNQHNFQKRKDGTSIQTDRIKKGIHHLQTRLDGTNLQTDRLEKGTHNFLKNKGMVSCYDKSGNYVRIPKEQYYSQVGPRGNWEFVHNKSKEAKNRK